MKRVYYVITVLWFLFGVSAQSLEIPTNIPPWKNMDVKTLTKLLEYGELISVDSIGREKIEMCSIGVLADASPEKVWNVITDFEGYTNLLPESLKTKITSQNGNTAVVKFTVSVIKLGFLDITTKYSLKYNLNKPKRVDISWVEGDVKNVEGYWELIPIEGGKRTIIVYAITSDLASANPLVGKALAEQPATVTAINLSSAIIFSKRIVEKAAGKKKPYAPAGKDFAWKALDNKILHEIVKHGRVGFISRIGNKEIATAGILVKKSPNYVWNILTDFKNYPTKIQQITRSEILEQDKKSAEVQMRIELLQLGPIKIAADGINKYNFQKPKKLTSIDVKSERPDLFNNWELISMTKGNETALFNSSVGDISDKGAIAKFVLDHIPAIQISVDLSQALIMTHSIQKWAEGK